MPVNASVLTIASFARQTSGTSTSSTPVRTDNRGIGGERTASAKRSILTISRLVDAAAGTAVDGTIAIYGADLPNPTMGQPLGNSYASTAADTVFPITGDGSTTAFTTTLVYSAFSNYNFIVETAAFKCTGTSIACTSAGALTATGSAFTTELAVGAKVLIGGYAATVSAIASDTAATLTPIPVSVTSSTLLNVDPAFYTKTYSASPSGPLQYSVTNSGGFAVITFAVAPPKVVGPSTASTLVTGSPVMTSAVYLVTPTQIKATAAYPFDRSGIRSRTMVWAVGTHASNLLSATTVTLESDV